MRKIGVMLTAVLAALAWGYGDLPDTFDATTGYVITSGGADGASAQSFYYGTHWSDGRPPHADTNYYVTLQGTLATPFQNADVEAQLALYPDCQTFKGRKLVVAGTIWHINNTYEFTFPDMRLLPGGKIWHTAQKTPLKGNVTVYGTTNAPSYLGASWDTANLYQGFDMNVKGDDASCLNLFFNQRPLFVMFGGDLAEFCGTLRVPQCTYDAWLSSPGSYGWSFGTSHVAGTVELLGTYSCLCVSNSTGLTVGGFVAATNQTRVALAVAAASSATTPRLTVTNRLDLAYPLEVLLQTWSVSAGSSYFSFVQYAESSTPEERALIRLTPEVVASCGIRDFNEKFTVASSMTRSWTQWRDDPDGGKTLWLVTCVKHTGVKDSNDRGSLVNDTLTASGTDYFWDNHVCPANDPDSASKGYYSEKGIVTPNCSGAIYEFPGKLLAMKNATLSAFQNSAGFRCADFVWLGTTINTASNGTSTDPARKDENGGDYRFYKLQGKIRAPSGYTNKLQSYGQRCVVRVECEVTGGGDMQLQTIDSSSNFKNHCGYHEFTALNTNFTGKVKVTTQTATASGTQQPSAGYTTPNWTEHVRLFVSDERNLGGARDAFAWDALYLDQYSDIYLLNDVTFTDCWNRGIAIGNIGRMNVPSNLTLTVWRPLNVNGRLVKEGNGTLALGGTLKFGGSAQSATPTSGANLLTVAGGRIKPLEKNAFDGLAITFTNNAALCVDGTPADAALRQYGLVNTKEATAPVTLAPNQATLPVHVDFGAATEPPDTSWTVGLVTLETAKATALKNQMTLAVTSPFKSWYGALDLVDNGNGTSTVVANYRQSGFMVIFR